MNGRTENFLKYVLVLVLVLFWYFFYYLFAFVVNFFCILCIKDKYFIRSEPTESSLNSRSEFNSICCHKTKHLTEGKTQFQNYSMKCYHKYLDCKLRYKEKCGKLKYLPMKKFFSSYICNECKHYHKAKDLTEGKTQFVNLNLKCYHTYLDCKYRWKTEVSSCEKVVFYMCDKCRHFYMKMTVINCIKPNLLVMTRGYFSP